ncbi:MAG: hypothetical protein IJM51_07605, partial [Clostridia bacterium]|nr:hypothetical protein [Clostridia bacterium]
KQKGQANTHAEPTASKTSPGKAKRSGEYPRRTDREQDQPRKAKRSGEYPRRTDRKQDQPRKSKKVRRIPTQNRPQARPAPEKQKGQANTHAEPTASKTIPENLSRRQH